MGPIASAADPGDAAPPLYLNRQTILSFPAQVSCRI